MIVKQPNARTCFVCGRENDKGLRIHLYSDRERKVVFSDFVVPAQYCGYPGVAHGGIVTAVLDEVSGRVSMIDEDTHQILYLTGNIEVSFKRPTPAEQPLRVEAWIVESDAAGRKLLVHSEIRMADGTITATGTAKMIKAPDNYSDIWGLKDDGEYWRLVPED